MTAKRTSPDPRPSDPDFLVASPQPYTLRNGDFGAVTGPSPDGGLVGFLLPSELRAAWDRLGRDADGDAQYDLMELVRPGSANATRFKATVERLMKNEPKLNSHPESD